MNPTATGTNVHVTPDQVHATLAKHMLADGFDFVLDLDKSEGVWIWDSRGKKKLMDFFSFFASNPVGMNHPGVKTPEFTARRAAALVNASRSGVFGGTNAAPGKCRPITSMSTWLLFAVP